MGLDVLEERLHLLVVAVVANHGNGRTAHALDQPAVSLGLPPISAAPGELFRQLI
jgi:hypothetical protein